MTDTRFTHEAQDRRLLALLALLADECLVFLSQSTQTQSRSLCLQIHRRGYRCRHRGRSGLAAEEEEGQDESSSKEDEDPEEQGGEWDEWTTDGDASVPGAVEEEEPESLLVGLSLYLFSPLSLSCCGR